MPRIPEEFINTLRERIDIEEFIGGYVALQRRGRLSKGLCPFHSEKTASFTVYPDNQSYYCFGCGKGGDVITFTRDIENLDYLEAVRFLADKAGLNVPEDNYDDTLAKKRKRMLEMNKEAARFFYQVMMSPKGTAGLTYWTEKRRLSEKTIKRFGLGYAPDDWHALKNHMNQLGYSNQELYEANLVRKSEKNGRTNFYDNFRARAMVPIIDLRGNIIAFGGRVLDDSKPKYVNTSDTLVYKKSQAVFALNFAKNSGKDSLILCEGYMDVIALHQAGFTNAVAGLGTALTDEQVRLIARYCKEVILSYDSDGAGRAATEKAMQKFGNTGLSVRSLTLSGGKDPDEIIQNFGPERFKSLLQGAANETEYRLMERRRKYDVTTDDGKVKFLKEATAVLADVKDRTERDVYISRLSEELQVSKEAVLLQTEDLISRKGRRNRSSAVNFGEAPTNLRQQRERAGTDTVPPKLLKAEEIICASLLHSPDFCQKLQESLQPEDFPSAFYRRLYTTLCHRIASGLSTELIHLSADFNGAEMSEIARLCHDHLMVANTYEQVKDCVSLLKKHASEKSVADPASISDEEFRQHFKKNS